MKLRPPEPAGRPPDRSIRGVTVLGINVNPRNGEPLLVSTDGSYVSVRSLRTTELLLKHGLGYYDTTGYGQSQQAEQLTRFPRAHTPAGATPKGRGYGTSLYTALSLGAYLQANDADVQISMNTQGEGICSESQGRSSEASRWWTAALERGLTQREEGSEEESCEEYVKIDVDSDDLERVATLDAGQHITYVNEVNVDLCSPGAELSVDMLSYENAYNADLVLCELVVDVPKTIRPGSELRYLVEQLLEDEVELLDRNSDALLAASVIGLDEEVIKLLSLAYADAGLTGSQIDSLWYRWEHGLEPGTESPQLRLTPNQSRAAGANAVLAARDRVAWHLVGDLP